MKKLLLAAVGLLLVVAFMRPRAEVAPVRVDRLALGTLVTVKLYGDPESVGSASAMAFEEIARVDSMMSRHIEDSEVNRVEAVAVSRPAHCSPELAFVLDRAQHFAATSGGAFDVTIGPLTRLWGFPDVDEPPAAESIDSALALVGFRQLRVGDGEVSLSHPGVRLDLGGAAKGFAVDRAVERLREAGVARGLIEAGGDIRFWGSKPDGRLWRFGVQHPRGAVGVAYAQVDDIGLSAIATSGDYEQFFERDGRRYHHILDPSTGYPAGRSVSATAWADTALDADILSTTLFILGPAAGVAWIETIPEAEGLVIYEVEGRLHHVASRGLDGHLHFTDVEN